MATPLNYLVILPNNLGDVIMTLPVLSQIKKKNSQNKITFLVEDGYEAGLEHSPHCDSIIKFPRKLIRDTLYSSESEKGIAQLKEICQKIQSLSIDEIINLSQHEYIAYLIGAIKNKNTKGRVFLREGNHCIGDKWSQYLYAIPYARTFNALHSTDIYCRISNHDSIAVNEDYFEYNEANKKNAHAFLTQKGIDPQNDSIIMLQPGAAYPSKRWPTENFIELGKMLINDNHKILITGASSEKDTADYICEKLGSSCISSAGELSFSQAIDLLAFTKFCITGDTAMMHAAAAAKVKVYALFGPTNPIETGPYGSGHTIFAGRCTTRPCFCYECKAKFCMKSISVNIVYGTIKGEKPLWSTCDIYSTERNKNGEYYLKPIIEESSPYFSSIGASIIRQLFESETKNAPESIEVDIYLAQLKEFSMILQKMIGALQKYIDKGRSESIKEFEQIKSQMTNVQGIGAFLTALSNIRLNSVPLIDPVEGVKQTLSSCKQFKKQIDILVSSYQ